MRLTKTMTMGRVRLFVRWSAVSILGSAFLVFPTPDFADEVQLPPGHGYLLLRVQLTSRERIGFLAMAHVATGELTYIRRDSFESAGVNAWITLVAIPGGRYYLNEYQPVFGLAGEDAQNLNTRHKRDTPAADGDTFQIVPGVVNYIGDWELRVESIERTQLQPVVTFEKSTLEQYVEKYPDHSSRFPVYLSPLGQNAISLDELARQQE